MKRTEWIVSVADESEIGVIESANWMQELVRCKDCKHWVPKSDSFGKCEQWHLAGVYGSDWFCADGERR